MTLYGKEGDVQGYTVEAMCMLSDGQLEEIVRVRLSHHMATTHHGRRKAVLSGADDAQALRA